MSEKRILSKIGFWYERLIPLIHLLPDPNEKVDRGQFQKFKKAWLVVFEDNLDGAIKLISISEDNE